ncbi:Fis family transcriptional regulator [Marinobacterium sp. AK62]|uniref:Fis family transcriptional regulator n=1 Tax=Marinobacterium alkalitolerans TaxID=1542925 RepID=A0ABS3ZC51_9GAMM|nr:Fis family transcriptional regulator [Marinobacterium alkalitolerans]
MSNTKIRKAVADSFEKLVENPKSGGSIYSKLLQEAEIGLMQATMEAFNGNQSETRTVLGISRATLRKKLTEYNLLYVGKR